MVRRRALGGAAVAPLLGGFLLEHYWWGSVFLINVPVIAVIVAVGYVVLPESRNPAPGRLDVPSAALSITALVSLVYAVKHVADEGIGWAVAVTALVGAVTGTVFVRRQRRLDVPLIDVALFKNAAFSGAVFTNLVASFALSGLLFFFSQYLQIVQGHSPFQAGLRELPLTIASIVVIVLVGWLLAKLGRGPAIATGLSVAAAGMGALAIAEGLPQYLWMGIALAVIGLGLGVTSTLTTDAVVASVPKQRAGAASAISETAFELGLALGIALLGSLMTAFYRGQLDLSPNLAEPVRDSVTDSVVSATSILGGESTSLAADTLRHAHMAFTHAMQYTSIAAAALLAAAAFIAWKIIPAEKNPVVVDH